jgi:AraC family transcriptional regulator
MTASVMQPEAGKRPLVRDLSTGLTRPMRRGSPVATSAAKAWDGFLVEEHRPAESSSNNVCLLQSVVFLTLSASASLEWSAAGQQVRKTIRPGQVSILPANDPYSVRLRAAGGSVVVSLEPRLLACAAAEQGEFGRVAPAWVHGADDPLLREAVLALRNEARKPDSSAGYAQSLAGTLAAHLVRHYSACRAESAEPRGGLAPAALGRTVQFIEEHLAENLTISALAEVAGLSPCHFARMFKQTTGRTPHQHLVNCRIARAKQLLLRPAARLAEVATQAGFYDQAHLTRCFRQFVGTTPASFARSLGAAHSPSVTV